MKLPRSAAALPRGLTPLFAGRFIRSVTQGYLGIVVPLYLLALGYDAAAIGVLIAVGAGASALLTLAVGWLADRIGRKPILVAFGALTAAAGIVFALHPAFGFLLLAAAFGTIGQGGGAASGGAFGPYYPAEQALIAELAGDARRTAVFASLSLIGAVGAIAGALLAATPRLLMRVGFSHVGAFVVLFWLTALSGAALALVVLPIHEARAQRAAQTNLPPLAAHTRGLIARFMLTNLTNGLAVGYLGPIMVLWFRARFGVDSASIAALYTIVNLASIIPYLGVTPVVRLLGGAVRTVVAFRVTACAVLAAIPFAPTFWIAGAGYLLRMLLNVITMPVRQSYVMGVIPPDERSRAAALSNLPSRLGAMVGPTTAGTLIESGWIGLPLELAAVLQLLNALLYWTFFHDLSLPEEREI